MSKHKVTWRIISCVEVHVAIVGLIGARNKNTCSVSGAVVVGSRLALCLAREDLPDNVIIASQ